MQSIRNVNLSMEGTTLHVRDAHDPFDLWQALKAYFQTLRPVAQAREFQGFAYPQTTNGDVAQVVKLIDEMVKRFTRDLHSWKPEHERWKEGREWVRRLTQGQPPEATFKENARFWLYYTKRVCIQLSSMRVVPSKWSMAVESVGQALGELPGRVGGAVKTGAGAVGDLVEGVAGVGGRAASNLVGPALKSIGTPLLIGGVVLGGLILLPRLLGRNE